ncbi:FAD-dependent oxidoreductase [Sphingomonas sp. MAH-20]|uniref:FAD-dependent oxidoreductase n=1 Tax=Sphingomonas horti TaxID=2682842 RepID=A0A6I4IW48_9SPHN|nr:MULTISPECIES: FAD-dependent oxidoreductase [Sphingomonas]MBA2920115.1 FAD-dependent oxidoreductase [Sphingomonas sp. CGMCC 1.13658]MVO76370.1 FAD-dependent oxidoreductase [Sphingomonas horti]
MTEGPGVPRRTALGLGVGAVLLGAASPAIATGGGHPDVAIVGAGVFGVWTATMLQRMGRKVLLVDAWGPGNARASSGGESRMIRAGYGRDAIYTRMARDSLSEWKALSARAGLPIFAETGVLFFSAREDDYIRDSIAVNRQAGLPVEVLGRAEMAARFPAIDFDGIAIGFLEPGFGVLMARRAVQTLLAEFLRAGGRYLNAQVQPPAGERLEALRTASGETIAADAFVFAAGPWLPKLFPDLLGRRIFPTRQEVFYFSPPAGDDRFGPARLPGWADFNQGEIWYGMPDLEARGFKIANDVHGPATDPDIGDRLPSAAALADARAYLARRFPGIAGRPLNEARVCQYENSANGDFLIDRHPTHANVVLLGGGSGHGFKHGPEVGRYAAELVTGRLSRPEPRFSLAAKAEHQARAVH